MGAVRPLRSRAIQALLAPRAFAPCPNALVPQRCARGKRVARMSLRGRAFETHTHPHGPQLVSAAPTRLTMQQGAFMYPFSVNVPGTSCRRRLAIAGKLPMARCCDLQTPKDRAAHTPGGVGAGIRSALKHFGGSNGAGMPRRGRWREQPS